MLTYAQASMSFILDVMGKTDEAQALRIVAWEKALQLGRHSYLFDMFVHPAMRRRRLGAFALDNAFMAAIARRAKELCVAQFGSRQVLPPAFMRWLIQATLSKTALPHKFQLDAGDARRVTEFLAPHLARSLAICLPFAEREAFEKSFTEKVCEMGEQQARTRSDLNVAS